jgi:uncharacterized protein YlaI
MKKCIECFLCQQDIDKIANGLNKKLLGRNIKKFLCLNCLANYLEVTTEDLLVKAKEFKAQGCSLFL